MHLPCLGQRGISSLEEQAGRAEPEEDDLQSGQERDEGLVVSLLSVQSQALDG